MTTLERDDRFADALEECCQRVKRGDDLASFLANYSESYQGALAHLVPLTVCVAGLARDPSVEFRDRLQRRLQAELEQERQRQRTGSSRLGRLLARVPLLQAAAVLLVALMIMAVGGAGIVQAADSTLPDSPLYQVKRAREWVQLALALDSQAKVGVHVTQILARGRELEGALLRGKSLPVVQVLVARLEPATTSMVDQALALRVQGNPQPALRALVVIHTMERRVGRLEPQASSDVRPVLQGLGGFLRAQEQRLDEHNSVAQRSI